MAEATLILAAFVAGIAFREFWPRIIAWAEVKTRITVKPKPAAVYPGKYSTPGQNSAPGNVRPGELEEFNAQIPSTLIPSKPPIDKRRRGVAELRYRAEQASMKPAEHQAQVTANNIKAMES